MGCFLDPVLCSMFYTHTLVIFNSGLNLARDRKSKLSQECSEAPDEANQCVKEGSKPLVAITVYKYTPHTWLWYLCYKGLGIRYSSFSPSVNCLALFYFSDQLHICYTFLCNLQIKQNYNALSQLHLGRDHD